MVRCAVCAKEIKTGARFCPNCGTSAQDEAAPPPQPAPRNTGPETRRHASTSAQRVPIGTWLRWGIVGLGALALIGGLCAGLLWWLGRGPNGPDLAQPPLAQRNTAAQVLIRGYLIEGPDQAEGTGSKASSSVRKTVGIPLGEEAPPPPPPPPPPPRSWTGASPVRPPIQPFTMSEPGGPYDPSNPPLVIQVSPSNDYMGCALSLQGESLELEPLRERLVPVVQLQPAGMRRVFLFVHDDVPAQVLTLVLDALNQVSALAKRETAAKPEWGGMDGGNTRLFVAPFGVRKFIEVGTARTSGGMPAAGIALPVSPVADAVMIEQGVTYPMLTLDRNAESKDWQATLRQWSPQPEDSKRDPKGRVELRKAKPGVPVGGPGPMVTQMKAISDSISDKRTLLAVNFDAPFATCWNLMRMARESGSDTVTFVTQPGAFKKPLVVKTPPAELPKHVGAVWQRSPVPLEIPRELPKQDRSMIFVQSGTSQGMGEVSMGSGDPSSSVQSPVGGRVVEFDFSQIKIRYQPPPPPYPPLAKIAKIQGTVIVEITIGIDGIPIKAVAIEGPPHLRPTAESYAMQWKFEPALLNGISQTAKFRLTMPFTLR